MRTFSIITLGCKVNQYESQQVRQLLEGLGLRHAERCDRADLVVVNTCCVTSTASAKSRQYIRRARKASPDAVIVVGGCLPIVELGELKNPGNSVHLISQRDDLAPEMNRIVGSLYAASSLQRAQSCPANSIEPQNGYKIKHKNELRDKDCLPQLTCFKGHTRAFLKVQDGCDAYCTYCIVPRTRPFVRSKPIELVLQEAASLVEAGHKEIVVTGIFLGAYGQLSASRRSWPDLCNDHLPDLLDKMAAIPGLARIRLSSVEPADVTDRLLETFRKHRNIMPHLHMSLQSGSDGILRRMRRQYSTDQFRDRLAMVRAMLDRPAITTDIIVGFPGETDADFEQTVELAKEAGFAKMHVFSFSPRRGTPAARMGDVVDARVIKERSHILGRLNDELGRKFREQFVGQEAVVLVEQQNKWQGGRTERYFMVYLEDVGRRPDKNELVRVRLLENRQDGMFGEIPP